VIKKAERERESSKAFWDGDTGHSTEELGRGENGRKDRWAGPGVGFWAILRRYVSHHSITWTK
jgi:hypothetical protein